jgi:hypothetical protein
MSLEMDKILKKKNKANGEFYVSRNGKNVSKRQASLPCILEVCNISGLYASCARIDLETVNDRYAGLPFVYATH